MSRTTEFLKSLNDYELAYFAKYKLNTYLPETQLKIKQYIFKKGLTEQKIEKLIASNPRRETTNGKNRCPRCASDKIRTEKVEWTNTQQQIGYEDEVAIIDGLSGKVTLKDQSICNVCGLWIKDPNFERKKKTFWNHILDGVFEIFLNWR